MPTGRTERGRDVADELHRAILRAPLELPTAKWSSRSLAEALGVSQSRVARAWAPMRHASLVGARLADLAGRGPVSLVGVLVVDGYAALALEVGGADTGASGGAVLGAAGARSLRGVLAADVVRDRVPVGSDAAAERFWTRLQTRCAHNGCVAVVSRRLEVPAGACTVLQCADQDDWLSLFGVLSGTRRHRRPRSVQAAEDALRVWLHGDPSGFAWLADDVEVPADRSLSPRRSGTGPERVLADQIVEEIRRAVMEGRIVGGDRISERFLAGRLHTSRAQVSASLRLLERDAVLQVSGHAALIPVPTVLDVIEIYAARQALGTLVVRAAVRWSAEGRAMVAAALAEVRRCAATGDAQVTGPADIAFQDLIGEASGLVRVAPVMRLLSDHLRIFLAVQGVDYAYPVEAIVRDDDALFAAIDAGRPDLAADLWRTKMNEARSYMIERLGSGGRGRASSRV